MFYYIYKPRQEITLSHKNFYEYVYERRSTYVQCIVNGQTVHFLAKKNVVLTAFKIANPFTSQL